MSDMDPDIFFIWLSALLIIGCVVGLIILGSVSWWAIMFGALFALPLVFGGPR